MHTKGIKVHWCITKHQSECGVVWDSWTDYNGLLGAIFHCVTCKLVPPVTFSVFLFKNNRGKINKSKERLGCFLSGLNLNLNRGWDSVCIGSICLLLFPKWRLIKQTGAFIPWQQEVATLFFSVHLAKSILPASAPPFIFSYIVPRRDRGELWSKWAAAAAEELRLTLLRQSF